MSEQIPVTVEPTRYVVSAVPEDVQDWDLFAITVERTAPGRWAVRKRSRCLDLEGRWVPEPTASERTDEWLATHRFDLDTAIGLAKQASPKVTVNGWAVQRALEDWHREVER